MPVVTDSFDLLIYVDSDVTANDALPVSNENNTYRSKYRRREL